MFENRPRSSRLSPDWECNFHFCAFAGDTSVSQAGRITEIMPNSLDDILDTVTATPDFASADTRHHVFNLISTHADTIILDEQLNVTIDHIPMNGYRTLTPCSPKNSVQNGIFNERL
jgi:hypothetical protein